MSEAYNARRRKRYHSDPEYRKKERRAAREAMRRKRERDPKYAARIALYEEMVEMFGDRCAICGGEQTKTFPSDEKPRRLAIDHDHATGVERGLLCNRCNLMLGNAQDDPTRLEAGAQYLRSFLESHNVDGR